MNNNEDNEDCFPELVPPPQPEPIIQEEVVREEIPVVEEEEEEEEDEIIPIEKNEILQKKDMFITTPSSKKNIKIIDNEDIPETPVKTKKKRFMSEEAKAKLAIARAKGMETRKRNALLRKQAKAEAQEETELVNKVKKKRTQKLKKDLQDELEVEDAPKVKQVQVEKVKSGYTQEDLNKAISSALEVNDKARKVRKAEKKKVQAEKAQQDKIFNTVSKAISPASVWDDCFN
tara:strand:- start:53 stop:748 length:696 start_codon:yes stop_codon:yes gene_type:complete